MHPKRLTHPLLLSMKSPSWAGALDMEGPASVGLRGCTSVIRGDAAGVRSLSGYSRRLAPGDDRVGRIVGSAGQASKAPLLDAMACSTSDDVASVTSTTRAYTTSTSSVRGFFTTSSQGFPAVICFQLICLILSMNNFIFASVR